MIKARKSVAHARSMMASGNPLPPDAHVSGWQDSLREAGLARIIAEAGELSAGKQTGQRARRAWPAGLGRRTPGWSAQLDSAERQPSDLFGASSAKRRLVPVVAAIAVAAIAVAVAVIGQQPGGRRPATGVGGGTSPSPTRSPRASVAATINVGWLPFGVAVNSATGTVYVANTFGSGTTQANRGSVSVISAKTNEVTGTIRVQSAPHEVAVDPRTNTIYVTNEQANDPQGSPKHGSVSVISGGTGKVTATVRVGQDPFAIAADPQTDMVYVANNTTVSVIDGHTNKVTTTIAVGKQPLGIAVDPGSNAIYVTNFTGPQMSGTVTLIDDATNTVTATVAVDESPHGVDVNPVTGLAYVANEFSKTVSVIRP
jgi:YVTN family beta-propeller protein